MCLRGLRNASWKAVSLKRFRSIHLGWERMDSGFRLIHVNELRHVMARGQADMNGVGRPSASIIIFQALPQSVGCHANDGVDLVIKVFRTPQGLHGDAVLLDFVEGALEIFFANKTKESNKIIASAPEPQRYHCVQF